MAEIDIFDALNDCIDRMNEGESVEDCLRDYPQFADQLRGLLGTGALVHRAQQYPDTEVTADQEQVRPRVTQMTRESKTTAAKPPRRIKWFYPVAAVASIAAVFILAVTLLRSSFEKNIRPLDVTRQSLEWRNLTTVANLVETQTAAPLIALASTATQHAAGLDIPGTPTPQPTTTVTATTTPTPSIVSTSIALMTPNSVPGRDDVALTATALSLLLSPAETGVSPTSQVLILPTTIIGATMLPMIATPPPASVGLLPTGLVPTTVMGTTMLPMTVTPAPTRIQPIQVIPLNAGEIDDNARWDTYLQYRNNFLQQYSGSVHDVNVTGRQIITVTDRQGLPVLGARVVVMVGQTVVSESRTYADGQTLFFPNARPESSGAQSYTVFVEKGTQAVQFELNPSQGFLWNIVLDQVSPSPVPAKLDVLFLLDSTGSMSDEIAQLQNNILSISSQIADLSGNNVDVRYGLVTYRDRSDAYVTMTYDFVPDVGIFQATLGLIQAGGGGDTPESLNAALHEAVQSVSWRGDDAVKLIFLVADAPPHLDYSYDFDYAQEMVIAAGRGIKIHPIASSGLSPDGEYIFRQLAEYTLGHFLFLTYQQGASGTPGDVRPDLHVGEPADPQNQQQGDYTVEHLDELVLRLITDELAVLKTPVPVGAGIAPALTTLSDVPPITFVPFPSATFPATNTPPPLPTPAPTFTPLPPLEQSPNVPPTQTSSLLPSNPQITISLPALLALIVVGVLVGYAFNTRTAPTYRKRKNEEIIEPED